MSSTSYIDALPYHDRQIEDPGIAFSRTVGNYTIKAAAQALIDAELGQTPKVAEDDDRLPPRVHLFAKSKHLEELLEGYPECTIKGIDPSKYQPPIPAKNAALEELEAAEKQGRIGEAHMALRAENTSILSTYGPNAWLVRNYQLNSQLTELQSTLASLKESVTEVNRKRRVFQEDSGAHLVRLEGRWQDLVGSTVQLELACMAMEGEVMGLEEKEETLKKEVAELEGE
nr:pre-mRNA-splicing factor SPF27 [Cryptococcus depauperatus CBS 7841]